MAISNLVNIKIKAVENLSEKLDGIKQSTESVSKGFTGFKNKIEGMQPTFEKMAVGGTAVFTALSAVIKKGSDDINEFAGLQNRLSHILKTSTGATDDNVKVLTDQAEALEKVGVASKESIVQMQAQLSTFDLQYDTIAKLTPALTDYVIAEKGANATTDDFKQLTNGMAQALNGNFASLTKVGFVLDDHTKKMISSGTEMERAEAITRVLDGTYKGFNASVAQTAEGIAILRDREIGNLTESIASGLNPIITKLNETLFKTLERVNKWIEENPKLFDTLVKVTLAVAGVIAILGTLGLVIPSIIAGFTGMIAIVKGLGVALSFLVANPIGLVITALAALGIAGWTLYKNWDTVKSNLIMVWNQIKIDVSNIIDGLAEWMVKKWDSMATTAKEWAGNMIQMFVDGLKEKVQALKDGIAEIATTISDYLGFHSPTKKGPGSDADKWMPNLIKMLSDGLEQGNSKIESKATGIAKTLSSIGQKFKTSEITSALGRVAEFAKSAFANVTSDVQTSIDKIKTLKGELEGIQKTIEGLGGQKTGAEKEGKMALANRAIAIEKEIADIRASGEPSDKLQALQDELAFANTLVTQEEKSYALQLANRTESQVILANMQEKVMAIQNEIYRQEELATQKQKAIKDEETTYKKLMQTKIALDNQYFTLFNEHIEGMKVQVKETINMLREMNALSGGRSVMAVGAKAVGGPVTAGSTYRVNEQGQEFFTPSKSGYITPAGKGGGITLNMGGVQVYNEADEDRLIEKMKRMLTQEAKNYNLGIS